MMSSLQGVLFAALGAMVILWFVYVRKLSHRLRDCHQEKYEEMELEYLWPQSLSQWFEGYNNAKPVWKLLRFVLGRRDEEFGDAILSDLSRFLRLLFYVYLVVFAVLCASIVRESLQQPAKPIKLVEPDLPGRRHRDQAFLLHRDKNLREALVAYDKAVQELPTDPELIYWRGMAHWQLGGEGEALRDFRRAIELDPAYFEAHRDADRILSREQRWDEILAIWDGYLANVPSSADGYFERAGTSFRKGDLNAARADAARACEMGKAEACAIVARLKGR